MIRFFFNLTKKLKVKDPAAASVTLLLLAFAVRFLLLLEPQIISNDSMFYIRMAKNLLSGNTADMNTYSFFSIHPYFLAVMHRFIPDWELAGRIVSVIFGSVAVVPLYLLISSILSKKIGFITGLLYIFGPRLVEYSTDILRESALWMFLLFALYLAFEAIAKKRSWYLVPASICAGLALGIKVEGFAIFPIVVLWIGYAVCSGEIDYKRGMLYCGIFLLTVPVFSLCGLLIVKPGLLYWAGGKFVEKFSMLLRANAIPAPGLAPVLPQIVESQLELLQDYKYLVFPVEVIFKTLKSITLIPALLLMAGISMRKTVRFSKREIYILIWLFVFFIIGIGYLRGTYYFGTRHGLLLGIPALSFAAIGLVELSERVIEFIQRFRVLRQIKGRLFVFSLAVCLMLFVQAGISLSREDKMGMKAAGLELRSRGYGHTKMLVQPGLQRLAFYADASYDVLPGRIAPKDIETLMRAGKASLLVTDLNTIWMISPGFRENIDPEIYQKIELERLPKKRSYLFGIYKLKNTP
ncbi:MAG: glycosyltransferase family 39 protein [Syntrophorhabdaceae bacterium]